MDRDRLEEALAALAREEPGVLSAYLFGSFAENRAHRESDVDVAVLLDRDRYRTEKERFDERLRLAFAWNTAAPGRTLDLIVLNDVPPLFARAIVWKGRRFHCADREADHAFVRDTQIRAADLGPWIERVRRLRLEGLGR